MRYVMAQKSDEVRARVEVEWVDILNQCKDYYGSASSTGFYENYRRKVGSYVMFSFSYRI